MNPKQFQDILSRHKKVAIVGGPKSGKSTLSRTCTDRPVHHNDSGLHIHWNDQPDYWKNQTMSQDSFCIEGIQASRAIRKGLKVDAIIHLTEPKVNDLRPGQKAMYKAQETILADVTKAHPEIPVYR